MAEEHMHEHGEHPHVHSKGYEKAIINRLSRSIGHLESIKRMIESGKDCSEVLIQLAAVKAAVNNTGKVILKEHLEHCIVDAIEHGDMESVEKLNKAIDIFIK
ncbi:MULTISPECIES: metal-sensing transcriptional repressor [Lachnospiraceae]|jgi:DNA-binding FrmR family transcriptional regulator|nr:MULTISPECIES: metal-sensing transcriptional repressor [Clostridia]RGT70971.1 CsoR family transcriptional regulator [Ruminococcus sp. AF18-22]SCH21309.1 Copper-sensitive operon repressor [uncultured Clostridium sp.]